MVALAGLLAIGSPQARGADLPESPAGAAQDMRTVRAGKESTALVLDAKGKAAGSACCVDAAGFFLTSAAIAGAIDGQALRLVLNAGEDNERILQASVVRISKESGLALLKADQPGALTAVRPGASDGLVETTPVLAFGYAQADDIAGGSRYPSIAVNVGRVTSLRKSGGQVRAIQLDCVVDDTGQGGPLLDATGKLVGLLVPRSNGRGATAVPARQLAAFLAQPEIVLPPPTIAFAARHDPAELPIRVTTFGQDRGRLTVDLTLGEGQDARTIAAQAGNDGLYTLRFTPLPVELRPAKVPVVVEYPQGSMRCTVEDQAIRVDGKVFQLGELRRIERREGGVTLTHRDGRRISGTTMTISALRADFGGYMMEVDTFKARALNIEPLAPEPDHIAYTVVVRSENKELARSAGVLRIAAVPQTQPVSGK